MGLTDAQDGRPDPAEGPRSAAVTSPKLSAMDIVSEAVAGLFARPGRMALTVLGTVIGLAALVATLGLSRTASNRIVGRFDELSATEIIVTARPVVTAGTSNDPPWDSPERLERLNGVVAAGNLSIVDIGDALVTTSPVSDPTRRSDFRLSVHAVSPGLFDAVRAQLRTGRFLDAGDSDRAERIALLGANAANRLRIDRLEQLPALRVGDEIFLIAGVIESVQREHELMGSVLITEGAGRDLYRLAGPERVVIETELGATRLVAQQAALALRPDDSAALRIEFAPAPQRVRDAVESDLDILFIVLGGVSLLVGAIGIANVTLVSVMERTGEIGLRRALGAGQRHIAAQFLLESSVIGLVGGVVGASVGILIVVSVSAYQSWTPVLDPLVPLTAPVIGAVIGLAAGAYPALRAARMEPVDALRSGS